MIAVAAYSRAVSAGVMAAQKSLSARAADGEMRWRYALRPGMRRLSILQTGIGGLYGVRHCEFARAPHIIVYRPAAPSSAKQFD